MCQRLINLTVIMFVLCNWDFLHGCSLWPSCVVLLIFKDIRIMINDYIYRIYNGKCAFPLTCSRKL